MSSRAELTRQLDDLRVGVEAVRETTQGGLAEPEAARARAQACKAG